ncbi:ATP-dependent RecD-like DNA helicase, partial [Staphylococcus gallinarum]
AYLGETLNVVENKPYQLVYDVKGIGFNKAYTLARNVGIQFNDTERLKAGLLYVLEEECIKQGHTYLPTQNVLEMTQDMLSQAPSEIIEMQQLNHVLQELVNDTKLIQQENEVAIPSLYYSELKSVQNLYRNYAYTNKLKQIEQSD